ncbi:HNH endonuclease [Sulfuricurvum sp.]|uniref:HNH endonuclease n=1 Tax=Sulfuricurvum sp. TaxID=2025608 RepID=UPI003BB51264
MTTTILNHSYFILDAKEKITIADSFVHRSNKIGTGNGEAKFYLGNDNTELHSFFGERGFHIRGFLLKKDLLRYLEDVKNEYLFPEQEYINKTKLPELWEKRRKKVSELEDIIWFTLEDQIQIQGSRVYVKSSDTAYDLIRELSLPNITYIASLKLLSETDETFYYFRLFVDYFDENHHSIEIQCQEEAIEAEDLPLEQKKQLVSARSGQGKYRKALLEECPFCPITIVADDRLLIASHIKPWVASNDKEKVDPKNGFMLTPTYDFLFDRGFITFTDDKKMNVSPWLSKMTCSRLNLVPDKKYDMLPVEGRTDYLAYHRENIFKK